ncbi:GntR family transcriptional regulator [Streptomyces mashuensis]|uniref:GntR family transcriptional regulator n=1 Tax=Streptomyces mashuensis TaxID=33904 RepID=A0A919B9X3_9ACTN|nr:GntR family transcriptional regulator [Streptomyces mashuensis]GHF74103.1 GntR family transcriptional regulator [Streptomyces mashuensis]
MAKGRSGNTPANYLRVADALRQRVVNGTWAPGDRLPGRGELGAEFGVGKNTVREAQELLIAEGLLEGRPGAGTYVRTPPQRRIMHRTAPPGSLVGIAPAGFTGTWESDSTAKVPAPPAIAVRLGIGEGALCVRTVYEFLADRQPVMLATSWEPMSLTGGTPIVLPEGGPLAGRGVVERMAHIDITVTRAVEMPQPVQVDHDQAELLGIAAGSQATLIERTYYAADGQAVETADVLVPAERWKIAYEIPLAPPPQP